MCTVDLATATSCTFTETPGDYTITGVYSGDGSFNTSTSAGYDITVNKSDTTTSTVTDLTLYVSGQTITATVGVAPVFPGTGTPTGTVTVSDQNGVVCTVDLATATSCTFTETPGDYTITGVYSGDGSFNTSTSAGYDITVNKSDTTTSTVTDLTLYVSGQTITATVGVAPVFPGTGTPTGTVTVSDQNGVVCTVDLATATSCTFTETPGGLHDHRRLLRRRQLQHLDQRRLRHHGQQVRHDDLDGHRPDALRLGPDHHRDRRGRPGLPGHRHAHRHRHGL